MEPRCQGGTHHHTYLFPLVSPSSNTSASVAVKPFHVRNVGTLLHLKGTKIIVTFQYITIFR